MQFYLWHFLGQENLNNFSQQCKKFWKFGNEREEFQNESSSQTLIFSSILHLPKNTTTFFVFAHLSIFWKNAKRPNFSVSFFLLQENGKIVQFQSLVRNFSKTNWVQTTKRNLSFSVCGEGAMNTHILHTLMMIKELPPNPLLTRYSKWKKNYGKKRESIPNGSHTHYSQLNTML